MRYSSERPAPKQVEIAVVIRRESEKAYLVDFGVPDKVWIPKSQISDYGSNDDGEIECIFIPEWLAKEKGMI